MAKGLDLGKQIGPLPLGAWIAVVGGGLAITLYSRNASGTGEVVYTEDGSIPSGVGTGETGGWVPTTPPPTTGPPAVTTNEEWGRAAINHLVAQGFDSAVADVAVRKYLESKILNPQELALIRLVLNKLGAPPVPLPAPDTSPPGNPPPTPPPVKKPPPKPTTPPKPKPPAPKPPTRRYYTVKPWPAKGSTLSGIADIYYGKPSEWRRIYNANRKLIGKNPNLIRPGMKLLIP